MDEILADLSRFSRDVELVEVPSTTGETVRNPESKYTLQLPNPQPLLKKIEQLERYFYQYKCFECLPGLKELPLEQIHEKFREILKNHGSCNIIDKPHDNSTGYTLQSMFKDDMHDKLLSKDYVIRLGEGLSTRGGMTTPNKTLNEKDQSSEATKLMPQFLRAIVTGDKLRLCGAFTENTTFLD